MITSQPNAGPRRVITLPPQNGITGYVVETLVHPTLFPDAVDGIRETEIIIEGARDDDAPVFLLRRQAKEHQDLSTTALVRFRRRAASHP